MTDQNRTETTRPQRVVVFHNLPPEKYQHSYGTKFAGLAGAIEVAQVLSPPFLGKKIAAGLDLAVLCVWQMPHTLGNQAKDLAKAAGLRFLNLPSNPSTWAHALNVEVSLATPLPAVPGQEGGKPFADLAAAYAAFTGQIFQLEGELEVAKIESGQAQAMTEVALAEVEKHKKDALVITNQKATQEYHLIEANRRVNRMETDIRNILPGLDDVLSLDDVFTAIADHIERRGEVASELDQAKRAILGLQEALTTQKHNAEQATVGATTGLRADIRRLEAELAEARRTSSQIRASAAPVANDETRADVAAIQRLVRRGLMNVDEGFQQVIKLVTGKEAA